MDRRVRDVRMNVVLWLQRRVAKGSPGQVTGGAAEVLEHAIDLALNGGRQVISEVFLARSVRRDAERIARRQWSWQRRHFTQLSDKDLEDAAVAPTPDPEQILLAEEFARLCLDAASKIGPEAEACLDGLLDGESIEDTAHRLSLPTRRVKYLRAKVRAVTVAAEWEATP